MKLVRLLAVLPVVAFSLSFPARASAQAHGDSALVFETVITSSTEGMAMKYSLRTRTIETARGIRVETIERTGDALAARSDPLAQTSGGYRISFADGRMISVDTVKREYFEIELNKVFEKNSPMMQMMSSMNAKPQLSKFEVVDKGAGEEMLGHKTRHWQMHNVMHMTMSMRGDTAALSADQVSDILYAENVRHLAPETAPSLTSDSAAMSMFRSFGLIDSTQTLAMRKLPRTLALKTVARTSMDVGPMDMIITMTTEVTRLERTVVNPSLFEIPAGYKKVEMPVMAPPGM